MKRLLVLLFLFGCYILQAQTTDKVSYYYKGKKQSFAVNNERLVMRLATGENFDKRRGQLTSLLRLADTSLKTVGNQRMVAARFAHGMNGNRLRDLVASLRKQGYVDYVHAAFTSAYGKDMVYGDELVVKLKPGTTQTAFANILAQNNSSIIKKYAFANDIYVVNAGAANGYDAMAVANRLFESGLFQYAEPDFTLLDGLFTNPNDPLYDYQWGHLNTGSSLQYNGTPGIDMKVQQAWGISTGSGITVAVIDEGVDVNHADLMANLLQGFDCISGTSNPGDGKPLGPARAHGTNCAGLIAAVANNNIGVAGVAPDCKLIPINLAAANGAFTSEINIAAGFDYAWMHGADVISNSWGGGSPSSVIDDAINRAVTMGRGGKGSVVLFASGNNNSALSYPASNENVISVGGVNMCGMRKSPASAVCDGESWGASFGIGLDVVAPCVKQASTDLSGSAGYNTAAGTAGDYFLRFNGTSSATPNTAGVVALILGANNALTVSQVRNILESTCYKLPAYSYSMVTGQPNGTWNNETGHGLINAYAAVQVAQTGVYCNVQIAATGPTRFCAGGSSGIVVTNPIAGTSYQWRKDGVNFSTATSITVTDAGSYDVIATNSNGCVATSAPIVISVPSNTPALTVNVGADTTICIGQFVKLGGNPVAANGAPWLSDKRIYGMDWQSNSFVKFSVDNPLQQDTIAKDVMDIAAYNKGDFFSGGDFTPYGYYAITDSSNMFMKVDTATGSTQLIGIANAPAGYAWSGLAWDPSTKNLYALASNASGSALCTIDPFTAAVSLVANVPVGLTEWVAVSNNGYMYALSDNDYIYSINKQTGAATALPNPVGANIVFPQDADFDPLTDKLYLTSLILYQNYVGDLRTVNTTTGISSVIGSLGGLSQIDATGIAGPVYQYSWSPAAGLNDPGVSVPVATPTSTTTYTLNVTDMCGNTASGHVTVTVSTPPPVSIVAPADSICVAENVRLSATKDDSYTYQWYRNGTIITGATDSFYVATKGGSYTVKAHRAACDSTSLPFIVKTCELRLNNNNPATACNTYFTDSGGMDTAYGNNEIYTRTISASTAGAMPRINFQSFSTESSNDVLTIFDGPNVSSPVIATLSGKPAMPLTYTASNGALTVQFNSNSAVTDSGWLAVIDCYQPNVYRSRTSGNANDVATWEVKSGGVFVNASVIPQVYDDSIIIQTGHTVSINTGVKLDQVWVQNGATLNVQAPFTVNDGPGNDLLVDGALVIGAGGSINGNGILALNGNLDNTASANSNDMVRTNISGGASQLLSAGGSFGTVYINNPLVAMNLSNDIAIDTLIINQPGNIAITGTNPATLININKSLQLQNGKLVMGANAILNITPAAVISGGSGNSFVEGPVRNSTNVSGATNLFFPVGKDVYRPVNLSVNHSSVGLSIYQAEVFNTAAVNRSLPPTLDRVSSKRHFKISQISAQPLTTATATLTYGPDDAVSDAPSLRIAKDDGSTNWLDLGGTGTANDTGTITSTVNFTSFSDFVLANAFGGNNVLPVTWLSVSAQIKNKDVLVSWKTTNELNVKSYTVERSADGFSFAAIATLSAVANSTSNENQYSSLDHLPLQGKNYYRIRQEDNDGHFSYSKTVTAIVGQAGNYVLWPSPAHETVTIQSSQLMQRIQCYNSNGVLVYDAQPAAQQHSIPIQQWAAAVYLVKITLNGQTVQTRFVKQ
ncbi:MAG: S8 family serine peptidase [Chitinophagaceae bacterium]